MSKIIKKINESDCVGDSLGKHNYNYLSLDQNICDLSSRFFSVPDNIFSTFKDLCANINKFNAFADYFEFPTKLNQASTATKYMSSFWNTTELNFTFPINIYEDSTTKFYLDENTSEEVFQNWGINRLKKFYPETNFLLGTVSNINFFLYSNIGKKYIIEKTSSQIASEINPVIVEFLTDGEYIVPSEVTNIDVLIVGAGGGGGGHGQRSGGGGGSGGGILYLQNLTVTPYQKINIKIGKGGNGGYPYSYGNNGETTTFGLHSIVGGNGGHSSVGGDLYGGVAVTGNSTGNGGIGQYSTIGSAQNGGNGYFFNLNNKYYGGGGGGGNDYKGITTGGLGGGGNGGHSSYANGISAYLAANGLNNTGGGGGGAARDQGDGARGGSGIVLVIQKQPSGQVQTTKIFNVNNSKDDIYIKSIKVGRFIIDPITKSWTFFKFI
jgi:hypothetical protein